MSAAGFFYQARLALLLCMDYVNRDSGVEVAVERLDDVSFERDGTPIELLQTKHHVARVAELTDHSPDLWKTFRIWAEAVEADPSLPSRTRMALITTGSAPAGFSEVAKRHPGFGGLIASLPLVSVLGMIWLWRDRPDPANMALHAEATFWFVLPSLPMFLLIPAMLRGGHSFWVSLVVSCILTVALYSLMAWLGPRFGLRV